MRGVAVLLVVAVHAIYAGLAHTGGGDFVPALPNLRLFGNSGVDLFFVISGFVMAHALRRPEGAASFLVARFRRIWPLYVVASLSFVLLAGDDHTRSATALIPTMTILPVTDTLSYHLPALNVGWTLGFECLFYLVVAGTIAVGRRQVFALSMMTVAAVAGAFVFPPWAPLRMLMNPLAGEFALGMLVWLAWRHGCGSSVRLLFFGAGMTMLAAALIGRLPVIVSTDPVLAVNGIGASARLLAWGAPWAAVTLGIVGDVSDAGVVARALTSIGDSSYSIYLFHLTVIVLLSRSAVVPIGSIYLYVMIMVAASLLCGLAVYRWIERPLLDRLRDMAAAGRHGTARIMAPAEVVVGS